MVAPLIATAVAPMAAIIRATMAVHKGKTSTTTIPATTAPFCEV